MFSDWALPGYTDDLYCTHAVNASFRQGTCIIVVIVNINEVKNGLTISRRIGKSPSIKCYGNT